MDRPAPRAPLSLHPAAACTADPPSQDGVPCRRARAEDPEGELRARGVRGGREEVTPLLRICLRVFSGDPGGDGTAPLIKLKYRYETTFLIIKGNES